MDERQPDAPRETDEQAEARMRHALSLMKGERRPADRRAPTPAQSHGHAGHGSAGHAGGAAARRHRFVQDGEIPVVNVARPRRDAVPLAPSGRPAFERDLRPVATDDAAAAAERTARNDVERRLADLQVTLRSTQTRLGDAEMARDAVESELRELRTAHAQLQAEHNALLATRAAGRRRRGEADPAGQEPDQAVAPDAETTAEPEPFKWWA